MGANRLPGKVLMDLDGVPLLQYQLGRVRKSRRAEKIIVATGESAANDGIESLCRKLAVECFRGSENDVLSRYYRCARKYGADVIVRLTADCPFSDPEVIDATVGLFEQRNLDYAANTVPPETSHFPDGFDVEVFSMQALERANLEAADAHDREHVTFYFWKYRHGFRTAQLSQPEDYSGYRVTVDYPEDLEVARFIAGRLKEDGRFGTMKEVIGILDSFPEVREKNSRYYFGIGWKK